jgi:hypothetical protein
MRAWLEIARYFRVVRPVPRLTRLTFSVLTAMGAVHLLLSPRSAVEALLPVLVLQAFTVSTGFLGDARRGHFDGLFTRGLGRVQVGVVYWMSCAAPGVICWLLLAGAGVLLHGDMALLRTGTIVAMLCVSVVPWALTVPLPRFAGAIGWLLLAVIVAPLWPESMPAVRQTGEGVSGPIAAARLLIMPIGLVGHDASSVWPAVAPAVAFTLLVMVLALLWIRYVDLPLESGQ